MLLPTTQMHNSSYSCASSSSKAPLRPTDGGLGADEWALLDVVKEGKKKNQPKQPASGSRARVAVDVCLAAACLAGAALLTWWALRFQHPSYAQLWMVPVGLVLGCTPVVVCVALHLSPNDDTRVLPPGAPPALSAVVVVKQ